MHRKKKIPVGFIVTFVAAFMLALSLTALLIKFKPDMAQFMGMIFFGSWLLLSFIGVGIVALAKKKNREAYKMIKYRIQNVDAVRFFQVMLALLITTVIMAGEVSPVYAAEAANVVTAKFTSLQNLVSGIVSSIGSIITLWGISEWGIAFQGSEGTMQANAFKRIGGGFVMAMAPQILAAIM